MKKKEKESEHLLNYGTIWYDDFNGPTSGQDFFSYNKGSNQYETDFFYCTNRDFGPDRTIIALAPSGNSMITEIKNAIENDLTNLGYTDMSVQVYSSRDAIIDIISSSSYEKDNEPGICFGGAFTKTETGDYQVNMIFDDIPSEESGDSNMPNQELDAADKYRRKPDFDSYNQYAQGGYMYLQNLFANALLRKETSSTSAYVSMINTPVKSSNYNDDNFAEAAKDMWQFFMSLIFLVPLYRFISNSVSEKETKVREAMKIMGLTDFPYWLSWLSYYTLVNTIQCLAILALVVPIFESSNLFLVFLYFWLYGMSLFGFGLFITSFFSSAKTAAIVGTMFFYFTSFLTEVVGKDHISESMKTLASIFPIISVQLAGTNLLEFEVSGIGLNFDNANELFKNYRFSTTLWMNVISFVFFTLLGLYLENILPAAVGVRKPFWFPFQKSFWCDGGKHKSKDHHEDYAERNKGNKVGNSRDSDEEEGKRVLNEDYFEDVPEYLKRKEDENQFIQIKNLKKRFSENFYAINGLNGEMYEDQIFALLGHNGAGKTTTINALCGMLSASSGHASIYGYDIKTEMKQIRKITGF